MIARTGTLRAVGAVALATAMLAAFPPSRSAAGEKIVELTMRHSRFIPAVIEVPAGTTVRFVVRNVDPIDHELIVGPDEVQNRHERGTESEHGAVPGEVTVEAGALGETTYRFEEPGVVPFGCHAPGHWAYGMRGVVRVA